MHNEPPSSIAKSSKWWNIFDSLSYSDMRILCISTLSNQISQGIQQVILGYMVLMLTDSHIMVGVVYATRSAPNLLVGLVAGSLTDRIDRRILMRITIWSMALTSLSMAALTFAGYLSVWGLIFGTFFLGCFQAFYMTARQVYVYDLVGSSGALNGIAIISFAQRLGQILGALGAGVFIYWKGATLTFLLMGACYIVGAIAINYLNKSKRVGKSGTVFEYSNIGYMLLGQVIENVESKSFEDVITEKLFKPFKMKSCSFGAAGKNGSSDQPWAHRLENSRFIPQNPKLISSDNPPAMIPAGGISCSQKDWSTFIKFVMGVGINHDYLSEKARKLMLKTNLNNYTYGAWGKVTKDWSGELLAHAGSNNLNYSYAIVGLDKKFAFLLNSNSPAEQAIFELIPFLKDYYLNSLK